MPYDTIRNQLLAALSVQDLDIIRPYLTKVSIKKREILQEPNRPLNYAYFIESGIASLLSRTRKDSTVEVALVGRLGFVGVPILLGTKRAPHRCIVQIAGEAL